ncbi:MAG TPA: prolipoprotein diacylglyceryl transferase [Myxococcota bacterium]|nr:prolipoprotein diacylglyceryl transferase [Myxococcota bacterium]
MRPWLFHIGDVGVPAYWAMTLSGFVAAVYMSFRLARRAGIDPRQILDLDLILLVVGVFGARLMHVLVEDDPLNPGRRILGHYIEHPAEIFKLYNGLAFYGGLIACIPVAIWYLRRKKISLTVTADIYAVCIPLGLFFGRLGCFLAGCCHGTPTELAWGVTFRDPQSLARPLGVPLHPTQLISAAFALILFVFLWLLYRRLRQGQVFLSFVVLYGSGRFLIEFLRGDNRGMFFGWLSSSQVVSLFLIAATGVFLVIAKRHSMRENKAGV